MSATQPSNASNVLATAAAAAAPPPPIAGDFDAELPRGTPAVDALLSALEPTARRLPTGTQLAYASPNTTMLLRIEHSGARTSITVSTLRVRAVRVPGRLGMRMTYIALVESMSTNDERRTTERIELVASDGDNDDEHALLTTLARSFFGWELAQQVTNERALADSLVDELEASYACARALSSSPSPLELAVARTLVDTYERTGVVHPYDVDRLRLAHVYVHGTVPRALRETYMTPPSSPRVSSPPRLTRRGLQRVRHGDSDSDDDDML